MMLLVSSLGPTLRELAAETKHLGVFFTPQMNNKPDIIVDCDLQWAGDNGAYTGFNAKAWERMCKRLRVVQDRCLFIVAPDVVADAAKTIELFNMTRGRIHGWGYDKIAFVAQDGIEKLTVPWEKFECLFIGGSTRFKMSDAAAKLVVDAKSRGKWVHVGRVNSARRLRHFMDLRADSVDGSTTSRSPYNSLTHLLAAIDAHTWKRVLNAAVQPYKMSVRAPMRARQSDLPVLAPSDTML